VSKLTSFLNRHFWVLYVLWILFCGALFLILQPTEEEAARSTRLPSRSAGEIAQQIVRKSNPERWGGHDVVNVAYSREGEAGPEARWIVLLDRQPRSGLEEAVVVELEPVTGALIRIREAHH
jgi:hypothetical protein